MLCLIALFTFKLRRTDSTERLINIALLAFHLLKINELGFAALTTSIYKGSVRNNLTFSALLQRFTSTACKIAFKALI